MAGRTENAARNMAWSFLYIFLDNILRFITRTVFIYTLGSEYLGLNSLLSSILEVLNLAELGVGSAMSYAMYQPIAENDIHTVCALLNLHKKIYRWIGLFILAAGLALLPFLPKIVSGDIPEDINMYLPYLVYLFCLVMPYFLFTYRITIIGANQRNDIYSKVTMAVEMIKNILQIIVLLCWRNYYGYLLFMPLSSVLPNGIMAVISKKLYPQYVCEGRIERGLAKKVRNRIVALFAMKISGVFYNSVDNIVISAFLGLVTLAKYGNYYCVMSAALAVTSGVFNSITSSVGNSLVLEDSQKNYRNFMTLSFVNAWFTGWMMVCLFCLCQPFMKLWVGMDLMFDNKVVWCFCVYFYSAQIGCIQSIFKDAAGLWREDMPRAYAANLFNLILNLILVRRIGVYGVLFSTILALLLITYPYQTWLLYKKIFHCSFWPYLWKTFVYLLAAFIACLFTSFICEIIVLNGILELVVRAVICITVPHLVFLILFCRTEEYKETRKILSRFLKVGS